MRPQFWGSCSHTGVIFPSLFLLYKAPCKSVCRFTTQGFIKNKQTNIVAWWLQGLIIEHQRRKHWVHVFLVQNTICPTTATAWSEMWYWTQVSDFTLSHFVHFFYLRPDVSQQQPQTKLDKWNSCSDPLPPWGDQHFQVGWQQKTPYDEMDSKSAKNTCLLLQWWWHT